MLLLWSAGLLLFSSLMNSKLAWSVHGFDTVSSKPLPTTLTLKALHQRFLQAPGSGPACPFTPQDRRTRLPLALLMWCFAPAVVSSTSTHPFCCAHVSHRHHAFQRERWCPCLASLPQQHHTLSLVDPGHFLLIKLFFKPNRAYHP